MLTPCIKTGNYLHAPYLTIYKSDPRYANSALFVCHVALNFLVAKPRRESVFQVLRYTAQFHEKFLSCLNNKMMGAHFEVLAKFCL